MHVRLVGGVQCLYCSSSCERSRNLAMVAAQIPVKNGNRYLTGPGDHRHRTPVHAPSQCEQEGIMPILMLALIALAAFGLIGLLLVLAVSLEQKKKINAPESHAGKAA